MYEDITIEIARTIRECEKAVEERIRSRQLGEAWAHLKHGDTDAQTGLDDNRRG